MQGMSEPVRRGRRRIDSRQAILDAAKLHAVNNGWRSARVQAIAAEAGVSRPTLYKEFPSKRDLGIALVRHENEQFVAQLRDTLAGAESIRDGFYRGALFSLSEGQRNPLLAAVMSEDIADDGSLVPTITLGPDTVVPMAVEVTVDLLKAVLPDHDPDELAFAGEAAVRLGFSFFMNPSEIDRSVTARRIADLFADHLGVD
jgi:AcrR family transcriptional regulator